MARIADPELAARRRAQILEAALACFRRRGFHQATMQEICAEAGISPGALYRYFGSKADIIAAIAEEEGRAADPFLGVIATGGNVVDAVVGLAQSLFERFCAAEDMSLFADVVAEAARDPALAERCRATQDGVRARIAMVLFQARDAGRVRADLDPDEAARVIMAVIDGVGLHIALGMDQTVAFRDFRSVMSAYLSPPPSPQAPKAAPARRRALQETAS